MRVVDVQSEHYKVAREYMVRLEDEDFDNSEMLAKIADAAGMSPQEVKTTFATVVGQAS